MVNIALGNASVSACPPGDANGDGEISINEIIAGVSNALNGCAVRSVLRDNGDGTITDPNTGLMWEKKSDDGGIHDKDATYTWSTGSPWNPDGTAFTAFLKALNTAPCFAGHCDWRLPTTAGVAPDLRTGQASELESILAAPPYMCAIHPCVQEVFDNNCTPGCAAANCSCTLSGYYWADTKFADVPDAAWIVNFDLGNLAGIGDTSSTQVRAVRGGV